MNTRPVQGWALPATAYALFEGNGARYLVLSDGRLLCYEGDAAPKPVLGPGPRPMGLLNDVVLTEDGARANLHDLSTRVEDVDGVGIVAAITVEGALVYLDEQGVLHRMAPGGERTVMTGVQTLHDANTTTVLVSVGDVLGIHGGLNGESMWLRPARGSHGERITAATLLDGGALVAREGYAMTGDEDVVEIERWGSEGLLWRHAHAEVVLGLASTSIGVLAHDQSGAVLQLTGEGSKELHHASSGVRAMVDLGGEVCIAAWFNVHGLGPDGVQWTVEHPGMPSALSVFNSRLLVVGDDGNDWTGPEPLAVVDLEADVFDVDPSELTAWVPPPVQEDDNVPSMVETTPSLASEDDAHAWQAPSGLLDALNEAAPKTSTDGADEEDLLAALTGGATQTVAAPFAVDLGEHREVQAGPDGVAEVLLEATVAGAPKEGVVFAWSTADGREIGTKARLLLRLPKGTHRFELRVRHPDGRWAMDAIQVHVA